MTTFKYQDVGEDYFNLDDILASSSTVPCRFDNTTPIDVFPLFGHKAPSSIGDRGMKAEVPLWMVPSVKDYCVVCHAQGYNTAHQNVLNANAESTPLDRFHNYFYIVGMLLSQYLPVEDGHALANCLQLTLAQRIGNLVSQSLQGKSKFPGAAHIETVIFKKGVHVYGLMQRWLNGTTYHCTKKRKLAAYT